MKDKFNLFSVVSFIAVITLLTFTLKDFNFFTDLLISPTSIQENKVPPSNIFPLMLGTLLLGFVIVLIFRPFSNYLDNSKNTSKLNEYFIKKMQSLEKEIIILKDQNLASTLQITENEKREILKNLKTQFDENLTTDLIVSIENKVKIKKLEDITEKSFDRIKDEISSLNRRGTVNLFIGITLSLLGVLYLILTMSNTIYFTDIEKLIPYLVPRALMVIFIEFFSFFFLNLYRKSLEEIKYFQNELTNLEAKYLGLTLAKESGNFKLLSNALDHLLKTERNFILKKDETTIELEKNKIEAQSSNSTIQALKDIISFKK
ncbi:hypothetical protein NI467_04530 [Acinetobacter bohemicus]|nr:hypothetical protein [Acinetobacter sp. S4397-1]MCO8044620.1 hypothetical protein [Acinetobacter sp. S4397-1]